MKTEGIIRELTLFWQKLSYYFARFADLVRRLIENPSIVSRRDLVLICAAALIAALFLLAGLIRFLTEPWKKKLQSLLTLLVVLLVLAVIAFFAMRAFPLP